MDAHSSERGRDAPAFSLVFPTYNPGPVLEQTWLDVKRFLRQAPGDWEVLFVCDGCTDGSAAKLVEHAAGEEDRIRVLSYAPNRGKGYAVRQGLQACRGQYRLF